MPDLCLPTHGVLAHRPEQTEPSEEVLLMTSPDLPVALLATHPHAHFSKQGCF